ncbi:cellulose biosynthesis cyclic di-GMP-binding regulatory protein BcsB [Vibrio hippocampi]|uniref:cellulose biosynthesis cyclic di-GMP-binding regulatory protein BcsB n=1 Tax=Vibrio hippocampi TaxID=654686 RepID=UPI001F164D7B|nr:cellulose biosynthesis cyclic di-GMP-binding regulatory protein BcsB [Vibrio hippocampi]
MKCLSNVKCLSKVQSVFLTMLLLTSHVFSQEVTFQQLGHSQGIRFMQGQTQAGLRLGMPADQLVNKAQLVLDIDVKQTLIDRGDSLTVSLNGQQIAQLPFGTMFETQASYLLDIPAVLMTSQTVIAFQLEQSGQILCYPEAIPTPDLTILPTSRIIVDTTALSVTPALSRFPEPFIDTSYFDGGRVFVGLPQTPSSSQVSAAAMLSSWFGIQTDHKTSDFAVTLGELPKENGIVFAAPGEKIGSLTFPYSEHPYIKIISNPVSPKHNLLMVAGKDKQQLRSAVWTLIHEKFPHGAQSFGVKQQAIAKRSAYDAPRWLPTDRPTYLRDLLSESQSLVTSGVWHEPMNISFRAAPDLFLWDGNSVPLNIDYRFPTVDWMSDEQSLLSITLNQQYLTGLAVNKTGTLEKIWHQLGGDIRKEQARVPVQPYMIYGDNELSLFFNLSYQPGTPCHQLANANIRSSIGENSNLDLTQTRHFAKLPNLSFFVGASFPFSRYSDLSDTAIVLPESPKAEQIAVLLNLTSRSGSATGSVVTYPDVYLGMPDTKRLVSRDVLAVSVMSDEVFNQALFSDSPYTMKQNHIGLKEIGLVEKWRNMLLGEWSLQRLEAERYFASASQWRGFLSYRSPWDPERVVVLVSASHSEQLSKIGADLQSQSTNAAIRGDTTIITNDNDVASFQVSTTFPSGELPWYQVVMWYANQHSVMLVGILLLVSMILGFAIYPTLVKVAQRRLTSSQHQHKDQ